MYIYKAQGIQQCSFYQGAGRKYSIWLCMPPDLIFCSYHLEVKIFTSSKKQWASKSTRLFTEARDTVNNGRTPCSEKKPCLLPNTEASIFGILKHYTQEMVLINGRKSINPTILSIQTRNKLQIWPTKKII